MEVNCIFKEKKLEVENVYACVVTACSIIERDSAISAFKGVHDVDRNNDSVKAMLFMNTKVHYIPRDLTKIFPNLAHLAISKCELKEVSAEDLVGLEKLESLILPSNNITNLPEDLFKNMENLKKVNFSANLFQKFDENILQPIKETIEILNLMDNPGVNRYFHDKASLEDFMERIKLLDRLGDLFTSGKHSDFVVKVQGKDFSVHKVILASLSPVFDKMFRDDADATSKRRPTKKTFDFNKFSQGAVEEFLRFFYSRTIPSVESAAEVMKLAVEFDVPDLKLQCEAVLLQTVQPECARQLYNLAVQNSLPKLKRKSFAAIQEQHPEVGDFLYDKPKFVNQLIDAKDEFKAKKIRLEKDK